MQNAQLFGPADAWKDAPGVGVGCTSLGPGSEGDLGAYGGCKLVDVGVGITVVCVVCTSRAVVVSSDETGVESPGALVLLDYRDGNVDGGGSAGSAQWRIITKNVSTNANAQETSSHLHSSVYFFLSLAPMGNRRISTYRDRSDDCTQH